MRAKTHGKERQQHRQYGDVVLVGGLAVACYTDGRYLTKDINMVDISYQKPKTLQHAMGELGFQKNGRIYVSDETEISVEFPSAPLVIGDEIIEEFTSIEGRHGPISILKAEDICKDRISAYLHWEDLQSLSQAMAICICHGIYVENLRDFIIRESNQEEFIAIKKLELECRETGIDELSDIEKVIVDSGFIKLIRN